MTTFSTGGSAVTFTTSGTAASFAVSPASNAFTTSAVLTPGAHASTHGAGGADPITTLGAVAHSGQQTFAAGSAAGPSIVATGDTNTGLYFPAADQVGIATAGSAALIVGQDKSLNSYGAILQFNGAAPTISQTINTDRLVVTGGISASTGGAIVARGSAAATNAFGIEFFAGGSERMRVASGGQITTGLGSAGTPVLSFSGDTNTGIYSPGADQVGIATAGTARVTVDASGRVLIGYGSNVSGYALQSSTTDGGNASLGRFEATAGGPFIRLFKSRNASLGGNTIVNNGDSLGVFDFRGADGSGWIAAANIEAAVDGTPGTSDIPGRVTISTRAAGGALTERMRIDNAGLITGTGTSLGAWTSWTPNFSADSGSLTTTTLNNAQYCRLGKIVMAVVDVTITDKGTAAASFNINYPVTHRNVGSLIGGGTGRETAVTGVGLSVAPNSDGVVRVRRQDGTTIIADTYRIAVSFYYEAA